MLHTAKKTLTGGARRRMVLERTPRAGTWLAIRVHNWPAAPSPRDAQHTIHSTRIRTPSSPRSPAHILHSSHTALHSLPPAQLSTSPSLSRSLYAPQNALHVARHRNTRTTGHTPQPNSKKSKIVRQQVPH